VFNPGYRRLESLSRAAEIGVDVSMNTQRSQGHLLKFLCMSNCQRATTNWQASIWRELTPGDRGSSPPRIRRLAS